jgi:hypothetical protein
VAQLLDRPNFGSIICQALGGHQAEGAAVRGGRGDGGGHGNVRITEDFIALFCKVLKLSLTQRIMLALALADAGTAAIEEESVKFLRSQLPDLSNNGGNTQLPAGVIHPLLVVVQTHAVFRAHPKQQATLIRSIRNTAESLGNLVDMAPILDTDGGDMFNFKGAGCCPTDQLITDLVDSVATSVAVCDLIADVGYVATESKAALREILALAGVGRDMGRLSTLEAAHMIATMATYQVRFSSSSSLLPPPPHHTHTPQHTSETLTILPRPDTTR